MDANHQTLREDIPTEILDDTDISIDIPKELISTNAVPSQPEESIDPEISFDQEDEQLPDQPQLEATPLTAEEIELAKKCQACKKTDWIYTCPRCLFHTCSLACAKLHKKEDSCSGQRDKTTYVPLQKYTESHMMSDYTYLEDVSRQSDNFTRSRLNTTKDMKTKAAENRARLFSKLANQMGIQYSSLPVGMSRHKLNQSNYSKNLKQIFWSIEINFCRSNQRERCLEHSFPSIKTFVSLFENLLFSPTPQGKSEYHILRHKFQDFVNAGLDHFVVALKKEKAPGGHFVNVTSFLNSPFNDVLKDEIIIENPIFYVWLAEDGTPDFVKSLEEKKHWITDVSDSKEVIADVIRVEKAEESEKEEHIV